MGRRMRAAVIGVAGVVALSACAQVGGAYRRITNRADIVAQPVCRDFSFAIYFRPGSDRLTREALQVINDNSARIKACRVARVDVTGLADADGPGQRNLELSRRRALTVTQALSTRGFPTPTFDVEAVGEAGAAQGAAADPLRRRTEVNVRFASPEPVT
jgi:outer membrane protein OmpA-like peptidoglycan-associated protein